jgi:inhibitor of KinA
MNLPIKYSFYSVSESAVCIDFGNAIDESINSRVHAFYHHLKNNPAIQWIDIIPAYTSVTVIYDVIQLRKYCSSASKFVQQEIEKAITACDWNKKDNTRLVTVPVCYHTNVAPDLIRLAEEKKISIDQLISLHTNKMYRVFMIGFLPGFAYMGTVDKELVTPRLQKPRTNVRAGSVGIAGEQTGIYPLDSPGGWNIIGQTPLSLFDIDREVPVLLQPGDQVKFVSISIEEFMSFDKHSFNIFNR